MSLAAGLATLAGVSVTGVTKSYTVAQIKRGVARPNLPALLPLPFQGDIERIAYGYGSDRFDENHLVRHRLLVKLAEPSIQGEAMALVVTLIDNYLAAFEALSEHSGAVELIPARYESGQVEWQGTMYYGCDFFVRLVVSD